MAQISHSCEAGGARGRKVDSFFVHRTSNVQPSYLTDDVLPSPELAMSNLLRECSEQSSTTPGIVPTLRASPGWKRRSRLIRWEKNNED